MGIYSDFMEFVRKQNVMSVALGLVAGLAAKSLIDSLVGDIITPAYSPYLAFLDPSLTVQIGLSNFAIGHFVQSLISFLVILLVVFIVGERVGKALEKKR